MSDDLYDRRRYYNEDTFNVNSTAGAVPVRNEKGQISMKKVKVTRYISGKRPDYAVASEAGQRRDIDSDEDEDESEEEDFTHHQRTRHKPQVLDHPLSSSPPRMSAQGTFESKPKVEVEQDMSDPRLRRLLAAKQSRQSARASGDDEDRLRRHRQIHEPEILSDNDEKGMSVSDDSDSSSSSGEDELDEEALQRRRELMRQKALAKAQIGIGQEEILDKEEEKSGSEHEDDETSEEETTDSEDEGEDARVKPVFVRKKDRLTVQEREREEAREMQIEREMQQMAEHRKKDTRRFIETLVKEQNIERKIKDSDPLGLNDVVTDDENDELEYEAWKLRELKRLKRDREEKENQEMEREEIERLRSLTEDERRAELKNRPKQVTNKAAKGKYKFMQKYYHRGAFFMADEENLYKRDYSAPTLEDQFDKTVLPKVMQVKNFGRSGRTKYTHLVDQDTTHFDSPWTAESAQNMKFHLHHSGGMKQEFDRPSKKKKK